MMFLKLIHERMMLVLVIKEVMPFIWKLFGSLKINERLNQYINKAMK